MNDVILNKYQILEEIGRGSFSTIYKAKDIYTDKKCAIKIEQKNEYSLIVREAKIHNLLLSVREIPKLLWFGFDTKNYYMVLPLLLGNFRGIHIDSIKNEIEFLKTGFYMLQAVKALHSKGYVHRDIKPDNFMYDEKGIIYLIDLGLCKKIIVGGKPIPSKTRTTIIGTVNYISINVHNMEEPSFRDDVESICYVLWKISGGLDWDNQTIFDDLSVIKDKKNRLIENNNINCNLRILLEKTRLLCHDDTPFYEL
jgi:serine/threonine protein kinase